MGVYECFNDISMKFQDCFQDFKVVLSASKLLRKKFHK